MGRVARHSRAWGLAGLRTGEETGAQRKARTGRPQSRNWKRHGRPIFLPASVPLDFTAG
jgi:hypothetical protein